MNIVNIIATLLSLGHLGAATKDGYFLTLEHSLGDGDFYKRGMIYFSGIRGEEALLQDQKALTPDEYNELEKLSKSDGIYRVRIKSSLRDQSINSEETESVWLTTYTYANLLLKANLCEDITLHSDGLGHFVAINIFPRSCGYILDEKVDEFTSNVTVVMPNVAPVPDTHGFLNKLEEERRRKEKSDKEPQSFLGKYWMYILPAVFFMMMQSAMGQQQQG